MAVIIGDGICLSSVGMKYFLSRELIADYINQCQELMD